MPDERPNPAESRRERELARYRREIIDAAATLFAENGYHQTTMQMIAEKADFSVGYLYKHFSGKEEMYGEMVRFHVMRLDEMIEEVRALGLPPLTDLRKTYEMVCDHFNRYPEFMRIYHQEIGAEGCGTLEAKQQHFEDMVVLLNRSRELGEIGDVDIRLLAAAIQGAGMELFKEMAERGGEKPFDGLTETLFSLLIDPVRR